MRPRTRSAALWGAVGALAFLALLQGYRLAVGSLAFGVAESVAVAVAVGVVVAHVAYVAEPRHAVKGRT